MPLTSIRCKHGRDTHLDEALPNHIGEVEKTISHTDATDDYKRPASSATSGHRIIPAPCNEYGRAPPHSSEGLS